jgi:hypothetical protein
MLDMEHQMIRILIAGTLIAGSLLAELRPQPAPTQYTVRPAPLLIVKVTAPLQCTIENGGWSEACLT